MHDAIASGFGAEKGDQVIKSVAATRPIWTLVPLPLTQVNPLFLSSAPHRGRPKSLQHISLGVISRNFDTYTPTSFENLSNSLLDRIFRKVLHDRSYDYALDNEIPVKPDEATIWAMSLFADPSMADESHTLALPLDVLLQHLTPKPTFANPNHPLVEIPSLYASLHPDSPFQLMTSLHLDGVNDLIDDKNIISLKYATNLTVLRMMGCKRVSDSGIILLGAALELPGRPGGGEGKGMWRLRAWYFSKMYNVSDKSIPIFARWPGLVLLDVRKTSCTPSSIKIFNRYTAAVFSNTLAVMQPCSNNLRPLFNSSLPSSELINLLSQTLLPHDKKTIHHRSLNIIPAYTPLRPEYLPNPTPLSYGIPRVQTRVEGSAYLTGGVGQLYGSGVRNIADEIREFRKDVTTALYMQALEEGLHSDPESEEDRWWDKGSKGKKKRKAAAKKPAKAPKGDGDKSKEFVTGGIKPKVPTAEEGDGSGGMKDLMMVRVAQDGWENLRWSLGDGNAVVKAEPTTKKVKSNNLVGDIMGSTTFSKSSSIPKSAKSIPPKPDPPKFNMFRPSAKPKATPWNTPAPSKVSSIFATKRSSNVPSSSPIPSSPVEPSSSADSDAFASSGRKRSWGGVAGSEEDAQVPKRRGMKMFSGTRM